MILRQAERDSLDCWQGYRRGNEVFDHLGALLKAQWDEANACLQRQNADLSICTAKVTEAQDETDKLHRMNAGLDALRDQCERLDLSIAQFR